jgi:PAS domain S-box-containing protein
MNLLFGYQEGALLGKNCFDFIHPEDLPRIREQFSVLLCHNKKIQVPPYRFRKADGEWLWMEAIVSNQLNHPDIQGVVVSVRDIHQQVIAEGKVKEMQLLQALMEGEEKERSRIARDLHDGIAGMIAAAKMHFSALSSKVSHVLENRSYIQGMDLLEHASAQVRRTSHNLMPEIVLENGLAKALERYCANVSNDSLQLVFLSVGEIERHTTGFDLALYRIAQELIHNIIRHSKATQALVQLTQNDNMLTLSIEDNGNGFSTHIITEGTGLGSIRKRVEAMKGQLEISSERNKGTQVYLEFAL